MVLEGLKTWVLSFSNLYSASARGEIPFGAVEQELRVRPAEV
jgi:hypothetical protein